MIAVVIASGLLIGISLAALGGGGSILAVPVFVYALNQGPVAATTGSLVVVGVSALTGAVVARHQQRVLLARGIGFGAIGVVGAALGASWSTRVPAQVLLAAFSVVMLTVAATMIGQQIRRRADLPGQARTTYDEPILRFRPELGCNCPRALKLAVAAVAVGLMTGFFGVGGGFLVVPALVFALGMPMPIAVGTSLVVITINSAAALTVRIAAGVQLDWFPVITLTVAAMVGSVFGARLGRRVDPHVLAWAFSLLILGVAGCMAWQSAGQLIT
ncbi:MAG: sulfite exporter TauE/SafE family protein [Kineosporiaceae bacterium]|nr:sulfite exporter TauE/SafE family protein [Aeromicrobium sp.]